MKNFLVLGGGFAGVEAAIKLRKYDYNVTLVSDRDYLFIYPISIWIPVKGIEFEDSKIDLKALQKKHGFNLIIDKVEKIDAKSKSVRLQNQEVAYDYLFIAMGMSKVKMNGIENTLSICGKPEQSVHIKDALDKLVQKGRGKIAVGFSGNPKDPTGTVVRGGPAFELLFNLSVYLKRKKLLNNFELNFFAPMPKPGIKMGEKAFNNLDKFLKHYRVNKHVGKKIKGFSDKAILLEEGESIESDLTVFIAGGSGHKVIVDSGLPVNEAGFLITHPTCQVVDFPEVYAIGDAAQLLGPDWGAKQGHISEIMADIASYNAHQQIINSGKSESYVDKISIVCVMDSGNGAAIISRTRKKEFMLMLPVLGHWLKKAWGFYYKNSKLKRIPRIPGM